MCTANCRMPSNVRWIVVKKKKKKKQQKTSIMPSRFLLLLLWLVVMNSTTGFVLEAVTKKTGTSSSSSSLSLLTTTSITTTSMMMMMMIQDDKTQYSDSRTYGRPSRSPSTLNLFSSSSQSRGGGKEQKQQKRWQRQAADDKEKHSMKGTTTPVSTTTATTNRATSRKKKPLKILWEVYIDQSKQSLERGGSATLDAFWGLAPREQVLVQPALLQGVSSNKAPAVRCIYVGGGEHKDKHQRIKPTLSSSSSSSLEVTNVDSVDKVFRILTRHMRLPNISTTTCTCLKWKYKGNGHLEGGEIDLAIDAYNKALSLVKTTSTSTTAAAAAAALSKDDDSSNDDLNNNNSQEGMILLMRATAFMRRAAKHQQELKEIVQDLIQAVPSAETLQTLFSTTRQITTPILANAVFRKVLQDTDLQEEIFRKTQYRHGLYQYALLQAAQDALRATQLLPAYATSWLRAGEILSELWKLKESAQYYERAMALDPSLSLRPIIDRLKVRQELLDNAKVYGWSEDTLRLALDVSR